MLARLLQYYCTKSNDDYDMYLNVSSAAWFNGKQDTQCTLSTVAGYVHCAQYSHTQAVHLLEEYLLLLDAGNPELSNKWSSFSIEAL